MTLAVSPLVAIEPSRWQRMKSKLWELIKRVRSFIIGFFTTLAAFWMASATYLLGLKKEFHFYNLNPKTVTKEMTKENPIILLHGSKANQSSWLFLAKKIKQTDLGPVFTFNYGDYKDGQQKLVAKMEQVRDCYLKANPSLKQVEFKFVGHSLGGIIAAHHAFTHPNKVTRTTVKKVVSIASRLNAKKTDARQWLFKGELPLISETEKSIREHPDRAELCTIWGDQDAIVSRKSAALVSSKQLLVKNRGHLDIIYSTEPLRKTVVWLK